jgi:hypothetical protein
VATLAAGLGRSLFEGSVDKNLIFSPLSIYTALAPVVLHLTRSSMSSVCIHGASWRS